MSEFYDMRTPRTQKMRIYEYLKKFKSITPHRAMQEFGIMRLAAIIFELRDPNGEYGLNIETEMRSGTNRFGEKVRWAKYVLKEDIE